MPARRLNATHQRCSRLGWRAEAGPRSFSVKSDAPVATKPSPSSRNSRKDALLNLISSEPLPRGVAPEWRVRTAASLRSAVRSGQSFLPGKDSLRRIRRRLGESPLTLRRYLATACKSSRAEEKPHSPRYERRQQRLGIRQCSCEQLFDLEISSADAVRLVPMDLRLSNMPSSEDSNTSYRFQSYAICRGPTSSEGRRARESDDRLRSSRRCEALR